MLLALTNPALALLAYGAETDVRSCAEAAPWLLEETVENEAEAALVDPMGEAAELDVATYNLHSGLGARHAFFGSRASVERNLRAIARTVAVAAAGRGPDIVALNEVDFGSRRSGWIDQARFVADELQRLTGATYRVVRGETWRRDVPGLEVRFGNAALTRLPIVDTAACLFDDLAACGMSAAEPRLAPRRSGILARLLREPRGVIRLTVEWGGRPLDVLVTHLDAFALGEREDQAAVLSSRFVSPGRATVLLGDMNAVPTALTRKRRWFTADRTHAILATGSLADASITLASRRGLRSLAPWATYPAVDPVWGLDWVLASLDLAPRDVIAIGSGDSDHRGLYVRYRRLRDEAELAAFGARHRRVCERLRTFDSACHALGS